MRKENVFNIFCLFLSFLIPAILAGNFTLNNFYFIGLHEGGDILDSGWQAFLSANASNWPLPNPPLLGGTFFSTHMSFVFYLYSIVYHTLGWLGIKLPEAFFFSLTQSFWFGLLSLASYYLILPSKEIAKNKHYFLALLFALFVMPNGVSLQMILHPHFEIAIPALLLMFFVLWSSRYKKLCYIPLIIALITKEDVGIHYFVVFIVLGIFLKFSKNTNELKSESKYFLFTGALCISYSIVAMIIQKLFFNPETMNMVYLGSPPYHHVNWLFIKNRFYFNFLHRPYIYIPLLISLVFSLCYRNVLFLAGAFCVMPWIVFSFFAPGSLSGASSAGSLNYYYGFPIIIAYVWPAILYSFLKYNHTEKTLFFLYWRSASILVCSSSILFCIFAGIPPDVPSSNYSYPIKSFGFQWISHVKNNQAIVDSLFNKHLLGENFLVDHAVAGIEFNKITQKHYYPPRLEFSTEDKERIDLVVFQPGARERDAEAKMVLRRLGLQVSCALTGTDYFIAKKPGTHQMLCPYHANLIA